jgi:hypothetical protein
VSGEPKAQGVGVLVKHITTAFFGIGDVKRFMAGLNEVLRSLSSLEGVFTGDNLITIGKSLSFKRDAAFMAAFERHATSDIERGLIWRIYTVAWAARSGMRLQGDFVECACYKGVTARVVADYVELTKAPERKYYLYDLFEHDASMPHHSMSQHGPSLFEQVKQRFADVPNAVITQGAVPAVLADVAPEKIAFMHLDLNNAPAEIGALEVLFDRMVPGAILILDDYGWLGYWRQKVAEDDWLGARGYKVLELPTGQGMVIK